MCCMCCLWVYALGEGDTLPVRRWCSSLIISAVKDQVFRSVTDCDVMWHVCLLSSGFSPATAVVSPQCGSDPFSLVLPASLCVQEPFYRLNSWLKEELIEGRKTQFISFLVFYGLRCTFSSMYECWYIICIMCIYIHVHFHFVVIHS